MRNLIDRLGVFIAEAYVDEDLVAFNSELTKKLKGLKRDLGVKTISQGYKGTGGQKHRRQIWLRWDDGSVVDVWVDDGFFSFGGITSQIGGRNVQVNPRQIDYDGKPVDAIYREVVTALKAWRSLADSPKVAKDVGQTAAKTTPVEPPKPAATVSKSADKFTVGDVITVVYQLTRQAGNKTATVRVTDMDPYDGGMTYGVHNVRTERGPGGILSIDAQGHAEFQPKTTSMPYAVVSLKAEVGKSTAEVDERIYNPEKLKLTDRAKSWLNGSETVRKSPYVIRREGDSYSLSGRRGSKYIGIRNKHDKKIRFTERVVSMVRIDDSGGKVDLWSR